jgi:hypothetical protein
VLIFSILFGVEIVGHATAAIDGAFALWALASVYE